MQLPEISMLGDSAVLISYGDHIDLEINSKIHELATSLTKNKVKGIVDIIPAYASLSVHYEINQIENKVYAKDSIVEWISNTLHHPAKRTETDSRRLKIPVCYHQKFAIDLQELAEKSSSTTQEIINLHSSSSYNVYMIGFLPGFAYMGEIDERIAFPRKYQPRLKVDAGSVGIAGRQTGIYPFDSPGGWQIIGKTPVKLFDKEKQQPSFFKPGDTVEFFSITIDEFENYQSGDI